LGSNDRGQPFSCTWQGTDAAGVVLELIRRLRDARYELTAEKVERVLLVRTVQVRMLGFDREAILRVTGDRRPEYAELRDALLHEHVGQ
jgi:hypothetical protein